MYFIPKLDKTSRYNIEFQKLEIGKEYSVYDVFDEKFVKVVFTGFEKFNYDITSQNKEEIDCFNLEQHIDYDCLVSFVEPGIYIYRCEKFIGNTYLTFNSIRRNIFSSEKDDKYLIDYSKYIIRNSLLEVLIKIFGSREKAMRISLENILVYDPVLNLQTFTKTDLKYLNPTNMGIIKEKFIILGDHEFYVHNFSTEDIYLI